MSIMFNEICIDEAMLPIYIFIYIMPDKQSEKQTAV